MAHAVLLLLVIRAARLISLPRKQSQSLIVMLLPETTPQTRHDMTPPAPVSRSRAPKREAPPDNAITLPPEVPARPQVDWELEAELAVHNNAADAEKEGSYRNLSGLSADQLKWIKENRMVPAPPGIEWHHPRFEFDSHSGLPIYWVNDQCVLVMLMIFCGIGHIEPNGQLFKHMHDPQQP
jgi:hypothetical protein